MTSPHDYLSALARVNHHGFAFLLAYGLTWLAAGLLARAGGEKVGAYAALFQGMVALPVAFGLAAFTADGARPSNPTMDSLSTYLSTGQLMILPLVIVLIMSRRYTIAVAVLSATTAVHFLPYSWLYQTPVYLVMGVVLAIVAAIGFRLEQRRSESAVHLICFATAAVLLAGSLVTRLI